MVKKLNGRDRSAAAKRGAQTRAKKAAARSEAARNAVRARWARDRKPAIHQQLGISRMSLWRYELPEGHPQRRPMPDSVRERYERLKSERPKEEGEKDQ